MEPFKENFLLSIQQKKLILNYFSVVGNCNHSFKFLTPPPAFMTSSYKFGWKKRLLCKKGGFALLNIKIVLSSSENLMKFHKQFCFHTLNFCWRYISAISIVLNSQGPYPISFRTFEKLSHFTGNASSLLTICVLSKFEIVLFHFSESLINLRQQSTTNLFSSSCLSCPYIQYFSNLA